MKLSRADIVRFQDLYQTHLGKDISDSAAHEQATRLIRFIKALEEPVNSDQDTAFMEEFTPSPIPRRAPATNDNHQQPQGGDTPKENTWRT